MAGLFVDDRPAAGYARVAVEQGVDVAGDGLTYAVPAGMAGVVVGARVAVPLGRGNKPASGYVVGLRSVEDGPGEGLEPARVKAVLSVDGDGLTLPAELIELAKWVAGYYACPLGMVFASVLPGGVKRGAGLAKKKVVRWKGGGEGGRGEGSEGRREEALREAGLRVTKQVRAVLAAMTGANEDGVELGALLTAAGVRSAGPVERLAEAGVVSIETRVDLRAGLDVAAERVAARLSDRPTPSADQAAAVARIGDALGAFGVHLLRGVTGSGKTEVYLRLIERLLAETEQGAIVLVPEIALTPQTVGRFVARLGQAGEGRASGGVAVLHSGLTPAQRHAQWQRVRRGDARVVVGARSAVFAPMRDVGLIVVDEEHESSYKQDQLPRYHARDVAIKRGQMAGAAVVLGSATPSLESWHHAKSGRYGLFELPRRVPGLNVPRVEVVDLVEERRAQRGIHLISQRLEHELRTTLDKGKQSLVLLNRRGFASWVACPDHRCGWQMACERCDAMMVFHLRGGDASNENGRDVPRGYVRCHHCEAQRMLEQHCPVCGKRTTLFGLGTQRVETELAQKLPGARVERMDRDTMTRPGDYERVLSRFEAGEIDVLLGTQMIAKGLDFPGVRLVGVISADTAIHLPDFRAAERTFQLVSQVAGRAGRGSEPGVVIVQSFDPTVDAIARAVAGDYAGFAEAELATRAEAGLPPWRRMARVVLRDRDQAACHRRAAATADAVQSAIDREAAQQRATMRGPMACAMARLADHHREQVVLLADDAGTLQRVLTSARNHDRLVSDAHTAIDVDPVALL
ncbi:MAG: primosomal protein N' [Planctomycetota bacterium]